MSDAITAIIDPITGDLVLEGISPHDPILVDLLDEGEPVNCGRATARQQVALRRSEQGPVRVAAIWHGSVTEGPGRRSVVQLQGCSIRCPGCYVPHTHDAWGGTPMHVADVVETLLDPASGPRDGVTILGGEPFDQHLPLLCLVQALSLAGVHVTVYSGYSIEQLHAWDYARRLILPHIDLLIEGPFVKALATGAGEWRGSTNQRIISNPSEWTP